MSDPGKLDRIVAEARRQADQRALTYRDRALKLYPWICGRCTREFTRANVRCIRPGNGLAPKHLPTVLGRHATRAITRGTPLDWVLVG